MDWPAVKLREVVRLNVDEVPVEPSEEYETVGVYSFGRGLFSRPAISGSTSSYRKFYRLHTDQIVLSLLFGWEGALARVTDDFAGKMVSPYFPTFVCDPARIEIGYLAWFLKLPRVWSELKGKATGLGDRRRTLKPEHLLSIAVPLPSLKEQQSIVARLDRVAALVEERRQALADAEADADALLRKAFQMAIEGADYRPMGEVAPLVRRPVEVEPDESYPEIGVRSFGRGTFHKPALNGMEVGSKKLFRIMPRDLVFNIVFAWEGAVAVAGAEDEARVGSHRFLTCVPDPEVASVDFLLYYFLTTEGLGKLGEASPGGAGRNRTLGLKKLAALEVPVPLIERQRWFDGVQAKVRAVRDIRSKTAKDLEALIPAMLHEVFGGAIPKPEPHAADIVEEDATFRAVSG